MSQQDSNSHSSENANNDVNFAHRNFRLLVSVAWLYPSINTVALILTPPKAGGVHAITVFAFFALIAPVGLVAALLLAQLTNPSNKPFRWSVVCVAIVLLIGSALLNCYYLNVAINAS